MRITAHHLVVDGRVGFVQDAQPDDANGISLLLLHTAGQSGVQWRGAVRPLAELGYRLLVPDLPGHGHSEPAAVGPVRDLAAYADWVVAVLDLLAAPAPVVVGCSIGGKIAQELAVRRDTRLRAVVSMCAEAGPGSIDLRALERDLEDSAAAARSDRTHLGTRAVIGRTVSEERAALIARMHCREDPLVTTSDLIGWASHNVVSRLPEAACPITFVAGEDDLWVSPRAVQRASALAPGGTFVLLEGCGHYPMEELDNFAAHLHGWITDMVDPSGR